jgi:hypothetical protein
MNKIMMTKYGFVRWPEEDFSDDGTRFTCYKVGKRVRVSKAVCNGQAFIDARIDGFKLPYEVYSNLPHYLATGKLNGVSVASLSDNDLFCLVEACLLYEKEYEEAENSIVMPTYDEIYAQASRVKAVRGGELVIAERYLKENIAEVTYNLSVYDWKEIQSYFSMLKDAADNYDPADVATRMLGTSRSIDFCKPECRELKDSWYYTSLVKLIQKGTKA